MTLVLDRQAENGGCHGFVELGIRVPNSMGTVDVYLLRPQTPPEGRPLPAGYGDPSNPRVQNMRQTASSLGIEFSTTRQRSPSTLMAHALLSYAKDVDGGSKQDMVSEKLFKKCFTDSDLLQEATLLDIATECGLDRAAAKEYITDPGKLQAVYEKAVSWAEKGISGVPTFYMNGMKMFSGAQEPEVFKRMFQVATDRAPVENPASRS